MFFMKKLLYLLLLISVVACNKPTTEKPLIGISCQMKNNLSQLKVTYTEAVRKAGGTPVLIPAMTDSLVMRDILCRLDGIIMSGGEDIAPAYYGEEPHANLGEVVDMRDTYDIMLARMAYDMNIPMLGICRGAQLINVVFGGTLVQDIPSQRPNWNLIHRSPIESEKPMHDVTLEADSQLAKMFGTTKLYTNSYHHQAVKDVAPGFRIVARAADGTPEAIESIKEYPIWGTQFHPEVMVSDGDEAALNLFKRFIEKADTFRKAKSCR
jgi:gamma-glutamyl-gamma-aminobutyrate hydrolase PuuD